MKKIVFFVILGFGIFSFWFYSRHPLVTTINIGNAAFIVDLAVTPKEKEVGLGNRNSLLTDRGMLFVYDHKERYPFWMKNMRFPIDIIWIEDKTITDITRNVPPPKNITVQLPIYHPITPVDKVLELPAGTADRVGINIGDLVLIQT